MKRLTIMCLLLCATLTVAVSNPIAPERARRVATAFWLSLTEGKSNATLQDISSVGSYEHLYLFIHSSGSGFVVVSGSDCARPVLAYSATSPTLSDSLPISVREWLDLYEAQIALCERLGLPASERTLQEGEQREGEVGPADPLTAVAPLLTTTWNQSPYYNMLCPYDEARYTYAPVGCVATAMAQIMRYWQHPRVGYDSNSYWHATYGQLAADFGATVYDWAHMPNALVVGGQHTATPTEDTAVALLSYHCGVAVNMNYGPSSSGSQTIAIGTLRSSAEEALRHYFGYKRTLKGLSRMSYTEAQWVGLMKAEIDAGRPVLHSGSSASGGHAFVADGYDSQDRLHFNWGWGGNYDGYFANNALYPEGGGVGANAENAYNTNQTITIGIEPEWDRALPWSDNFEQPSLAYWTTVNLSTNSALGWQLNTEAGRTGVGRNSSRCALSHSTSSDGSSAAPDSWLISPRIHLPASAQPATLRWYDAAAGSNYAEQYSVLVSTSPQTSTFTTTLYNGTLTSAAYTQRSVSLAAYAGQDIYIAFRHHGAGGHSGLCLDDISISTANTATYTISGLPSNAAHGHVIGTTTDTAGTEVDLTATANEGYRFVRWNDGCYFNPRTMRIAANESYTALFEPVQGDTLYYHNSTATGYTYGRSNGGDTYFGMRLTPDMQRGHQHLTQVMINSGRTGLHELLIYRGTASAPTSLLYRQDTTLDEANVWHGIVLDTIQLLDTTQSLWVVFHTRGIAYAAKAVAYGGNEDGSWYSEDGTHWFSATGFSWPINVVMDGYYVPVGFNSLRVVSADSSRGTVSGSGFYPHGSTVTFSATPAAGYRFAQWQDGDTNRTRTLRISYNCTYTATFATTAAIYIAARPTTTGRGTVSGSGYYEPGSNDTLRASAAAGCRFVGWTDGSTANPLIVNVSTPLTYLAQFEPLQGDTLYYDNGVQATSIGYGSTERSFYWAMRLPSELLTQHSLLSAVQLYTSSAGNYTLYVFEGGETAPEYVIYTQDTSFSSSGQWHTVVLDSALTINQARSLWVGFHNVGVNYPAAVSINAGNADQGYYSESGSSWHPMELSNRPYSVMIRAIMPSGVPQRFNLTVLSADTTMGTTTGTGNYLLGTNVAIQARPKTGHRFVQWSDGNQSQSRTVRVTSNLTLTAHFARNIYTLNVASANNTRGTVSGGGNYLYGDSATLVATPATGCHFVQWNDGDTMRVRRICITANASYTARFDIDTFTIVGTSADTAMGIVNGSGRYAYGELVTMRAVANAGYRFAQRSDGTTRNPQRFAATANVVLSATFVPDTFSITAQSADPAMGHVEGSGRYAYGSHILLTAIANPGYHFVQWHDEWPDSARTITIRTNATYTALFARDADSVDIHTSVAAGHGTVSGAGRYAVGSTVVLMATPANGSRFISWHITSIGQRDTSAYTTEPMLQFVAESDMTVEATFAEISGIEEASSIFTYQLNGLLLTLQGSTDESIRVYDMLGRCVAQSDLRNGSCTPMKLPSAGVYMVRIGQRHTLRIVATGR